MYIRINITILWYTITIINIIINSIAQYKFFDLIIIIIVVMSFFLLGKSYITKSNKFIYLLWISIKKENLLGFKIKPILSLVSAP